MPGYIFRFPADTPPLTYAELSARIERQNHGYATGEIGTTVKLYQSTSHDGEPYVALYLYGLELANIYPGRVDFTEHGDQHMATTQWLAQIVADNGIRGLVYTEHFVRYLGGTPLEGHTFPVAAAIREAGTPR